MCTDSRDLDRIRLLLFFYQIFVDVSFFLVWYGMVWQRSVKAHQWPVGGWALTDRHDLAPCTGNININSLHRATASLIIVMRSNNSNNSNEVY